MDALSATATVVLYLVGTVVVALVLMFGLVLLGFKVFSDWVDRQEERERRYLSDIRNGRAPRDADED